MGPSCLRLGLLTLVVCTSSFSPIITETVSASDPVSLTGPDSDQQIVWSATEKRILASLSLSALGEPPEAPSNRVANHPVAVTLGKALFFDPRLSGNQQISCATCHREEEYFTDGRPRSVGAGKTARNAPTLIGTAFNTWFYWDGRRDSLWAQALLPIEAADEMGGSRIRTIRLINADITYRDQYRTLFESEPPPEILLTTDASPYGNPAQRNSWNRMSSQHKQIINKAFANVGKVIAAYERTLLPRRTRIDDYIDAIVANTPRVDRALLNVREARGLKLFISVAKTQCLNCHNGPLMTNGGFHNIGTGNLSGETLDFGRMVGLRAVLMDEFNCLGHYSDTGRENCAALRFLNKDAHSAVQGAFKVPTLRGVSRTAPYMHDGSMATLSAVVSHYQKTSREELGDELKPLDLSPQEVEDLLYFLKAL